MPAQDERTEAIKLCLMNSREDLTFSETYLRHISYLPRGTEPWSKTKFRSKMSQFPNHVKNCVVSVGGRNGEETFRALTDRQRGRIVQIIEHLRWFEGRDDFWEFGEPFSLEELQEYCNRSITDGVHPFSEDEIRWAARKFISGKPRKFLRFLHVVSWRRPSSDRWFVVDNDTTDRRKPFLPEMIREES